MRARGIRGGYYDKIVVNHVDIAIGENNRIFGVIGENGAGKSTLH